MNNVEDRNYFWKKKEIMTYILSVLVFFIHVSSFNSYPDKGDWISTFNKAVFVIVDSGLSRLAVPLFFVISGALFFRNYSNETFVAKLKSRVHSLLIPYLCWNVIWLVFSIVISYTPISNLLTGREKFVISLPNILEAILHYGCYEPFWFIFALMVFVLFSPVIDLIVRNRYVGFGVIGLLLILNAYKIGLPTPFFNSRTSIIQYLLGAMIGKHWFNEFSRKSQLKSQIRGAIIVAGFAVLSFFRDMGLLPNPVYEIVTNSVVKNLLLLVAAMGLWNMADLFMDRVQLRHYHSTSFGVFAMHINVSAVVTKLAYFALPKSGIFAVVNFGITVLVTLALIDVFYIVLEKGSPKLLRLLTGGRNA